MKRRLIPAASLLAAATAMATAGVLTLPAHGANASRNALPDVSPSWSNSGNDHGAVAASKVISGRVYLASRDEAGLNAFVAAVSTPGSRQYGHYLTPAQAWARFGARPGAGAEVAAWLKSIGLRVTG